MDALIDQFFNIDVMLRTWPILMNGLGMTLLLCLAVTPLGLFGRIGISNRHFPTPLRCRKGRWRPLEHRLGVAQCPVLGMRIGVRVVANRFQAIIQR